jgi:hypothetical protein
VVVNQQDEGEIEMKNYYWIETVTSAEETCMYEELGREIAKLLGLKKHRVCSPEDMRYLTSGGTKSDEGLGRMVARLVFEAHQI